MSRIIGYARVSTEDQNLDMQKMAIEKYAEEQAGTNSICRKNFSPQNRAYRIKHALKAAATGDRFVVYKLTVLHVARKNFTS